MSWRLSGSVTNVDAFGRPGRASVDDAGGDATADGAVEESELRL
jgi:hypothetical protein